MMDVTITDGDIHRAATAWQAVLRNLDYGTADLYRAMLEAAAPGIVERHTASLCAELNLAEKERRDSTETAECAFAERDRLAADMREHAYRMIEAVRDERCDAQILGSIAAGILRIADGT
jgi:hypothetical protein